MRWRTSLSTTESVYEGAHSGTLPTLRLAGTSGHKARDVSVSFAEMTSFYYDWNTTVYPPKIANQIDTEIDRYQSRPLRGTATQILNDVSIGRLCPKEGLRAFLSELIEVVDLLSKANCSEEKKVVLDNHSITAITYYKNLDNGYSLLQKALLAAINYNH